MVIAEAAAITPRQGHHREGIGLRRNDGHRGSRPQGCLEEIDGACRHGEVCASKAPQSQSRMTTHIRSLVYILVEVCCLSLVLLPVSTICRAVRRNSSFFLQSNTGKADATVQKLHPGARSTRRNSLDFPQRVSHVVDLEAHRCTPRFEGAVPPKKRFQSNEGGMFRGWARMCTPPGACECSWKQYRGEGVAWSQLDLTWP